MNKMSPFEAEMALEQHPGGNENIYIKNGPHYAFLGRPVMGGALMAQGLVAAYKTVSPEFQIHHLTTQFLQPTQGKLPIAFEITRTNDSKNNAGRTVSIVQKGSIVAVIVFSFIRKPILDKQSPNYQPHFPNYKTIEEPDDEVDDMKYAGKGMIQAQGLGRTFDHNALDFADNKTHHYLKIIGLSSPTGTALHHAGLVLISDHFVLDSPARLLNLQIGTGEPKVDTHPNHQATSPYNKRTTKNLARGFKDVHPSDLKALYTLNHTIHFHDAGKLKADKWLLMEINSHSAFGGRVLIQSKIFAYGGGLVASCTQEGYYRVREEAVSKL